MRARPSGRTDVANFLRRLILKNHYLMRPSFQVIFLPNIAAPAGAMALRAAPASLRPEKVLVPSPFPFHILRHGVWPKLGHCGPTKPIDPLNINHFSRRSWGLVSAVSLAHVP